MRQNGWVRRLRARARRTVVRVVTRKSRGVRRRALEHVGEIRPVDDAPTREVTTKRRRAVEHVGHVANVIDDPGRDVAIERLRVTEHVIHANRSRGVPLAQVLVEELAIGEQIVHVEQARGVPRRDWKSRLAALVQTLTRSVKRLFEARVHGLLQGDGG